MQFDNQKTRNVADVVAKILAGESAQTEPEMLEEALTGNQHKIDANKNNKVDAHDFKLLRAQKEKEKANSMKHGKEVKEETEELDETPKVDQGLSGKQKVAARAARADNSPILNVGNTTGGQWRGKTSPSPYKNSNIAKSGERKGMVTKSALQRTKDDIKSRLNKEETEEIEEATPTGQQIKQGIGIARDKRYAKGNVTGAVSAMDKVNKGIAQHPVVKKELRKQNEETELTESHFKVGDEVVCKASGMEGEVVKVDPKGEGKYYTVKQEDGTMKKFAPEELKLEDEDDKEEMKEEVEQLDEIGNTPAGKKALGSYVKKASKDLASRAFDHGEDEHRQYGYGDDDKEDDRVDREEKKIETRQKGIARAATRLTKEENIDEAMFPGTKEYEKKFGQSPQQKLKKKGDTVPTSQGDMTKTDKGIAHRRKFTEMLESYKKGGLKTVAGMMVKEEPDNEEFTKEVEDQKAKMDGKKKGADVAKGSVQAVKNEETDIAVINADIANGVEMVDIAEREMTDAEMKKREDIVKDMKKSMAGFKQRYGDRAKNVMYATATKSAMKD